MRCLQELDVQLKGDVLIESVVDEEYGGSHGVLAARLRGHNADVAFNSEPTHMVACTAHRGGREAYLRFRGRPGMAFEGGETSDPIVALGRAICAIRQFDDDRNNAARVPDLYRASPRLPFYLNQVGGGGTEYLDAIGTPGETYMHLWAEVFEGTTAEEFDGALLQSIRREFAAHPDCASQEMEFVPTIRWLPGSAMPADHPSLPVLEAAFSGLEPGFQVGGASFACDAYIFNLYSSFPAVILGPGGGNAHAPDEFVLTSDLLALAKVCARFMWRWCETE
jgi:acetylornithine deacetylase